MINYMSQQASTIEGLKRDNEERKAKDPVATQDDNGPILGASRLMLTQGPIGGGSAAPYANGITPQPTGFGRF
jgi:clathrin heavy chain